MIFDDTRCTLGEGPLWHPLRHELFWFDILGRQLRTADQHWQFDEYVSAAGWVDRDTLLVASQSALNRFDITDGTLEPLVPLEADDPITRSNDGRADPYGGFWIGTMGIGLEQEKGAIYRYYKGEVRQLFGGITVSNAICFAPDGDTALYTDTPLQKVMRVKLDGNGWPTGDPWVHVDLTGTSLRPDGAVMDKDGRLFSAQWGAARVAVYDPNGTFVEAFGVPGVQSSCPAFGGPDLTTLYCTSAAEGLDGPDDGKTFVIDTDYRGQAEHQVIL